MGGEQAEVIDPIDIGDLLCRGDQRLIQADQGMGLIAGVLRIKDAHGGCGRKREVVDQDRGVALTPDGG
ncbi:MAG: hypothetical protein RLN77_07735, partial [Rhodospirillales bacterium]